METSQSRTGNAVGLTIAICIGIVSSSAIIFFTGMVMKMAAATGSLT